MFSKNGVSPGPFEIFPKVHPLGGKQGFPDDDDDQHDNNGGDSIQS